MILFSLNVFSVQFGIGTYHFLIKEYKAIYIIQSHPSSGTLEWVFLTVGAFYCNLGIL